MRRRSFRGRRSFARRGGRRRIAARRMRRGRVGARRIGFRM